MLLPIVLFFFTGQAVAAEPLTEAEVKQFIEAAEALKAMEGEMENGDLDVGIDGNPLEMLGEIFADDGSLRIMQRIITQMEDDPNVGPKVSRTIKDAGFSSNDAFASVGDRLIIAAAKSEMSQSDLKDLREAKRMSQGDLRMLPQSVRKPLQDMLRFGDAVEAVPASDVALFKRYETKLEQLTD
jgi:hypothetical protein